VHTMTTLHRGAATSAHIIIAYTALCHSRRVVFFTRCLRICERRLLQTS
jgi:hypothetical protein